jgi:DNA repair exonuclease SbcCD ATPase subunit
LQDLKDRLRFLQTAVTTGLNEVNLLQKNIETNTQKKAALESDAAAYRQASVILHRLGVTAREQVCRHLELVVTKALQYIYGPDFRFIIELEEQRNRPHIEFYVQSGNGTKNRPRDCRGGGVGDIVSLALRIAVLTLFQNPYLNGPLVLDEPGKFLDAQGAVRLGEFLKFVSDTFNRQVIVITHHESIVPFADKAIRINLHDNHSVATELNQGEWLIKPAL